ncbi:MAG TPA: glycoside hydrolase family 27 protein [Opitutales bacterium]|nr:glycoside hydrolase family 27 protein [Opitutales bacterium]
MKRICIVLTLGTALLLVACNSTTSIAETIPSGPKFWSFAKTPPLGWNSYDAWGDTVTEEQTLANAQYLHDHLQAHGWQYIIVDFRWYDPDARGIDSQLNRTRTGAQLAADAYGRLLPAPNRFPSAADGQGFKALADKVHALGLKFGVHMMRGVPRQAVLAKTPIEGSTFTAADAGNPDDKCPWCPDMFGARDNAAAQAWYDAEYRLFAEWGVDFVKVDDLSVPYHQPEIEMIRHAIDRTGRAIVFSTSPGPTKPEYADNLKMNANMWRISGDFWDRWVRLDAQFDLFAAWDATGAAGPGHFPDGDMIPFGRITIRSRNGGTDHRTHFTPDEQVTLLSLWALESSPLMLGMNLPDNDAWTNTILTNDEMLRIDQDPLAQPAQRVAQQDGLEVWVKDLHDGAKAAGLFNRTNATANVTLDWAAAKLSGQQNLRDVWTHKDLGAFENSYSTPVPAHGAVLVKITAAK